MKNPACMSAALAVAAALAITGCSSSGAGGSSTPTNPVDIMRKVTGCVIPPGTSVGRSDLYGGRFASCDLPSGDQITVWTETSKSAIDSIVSANGGSSTDGRKIIVGPNFAMLYDAADDGSGTFTFDPPAATIVQEVGGVLR